MSIKTITVFRIVIFFFIFSVATLFCGCTNKGNTEELTNKTKKDTINYMNFAYTKVLAFATVEATGPYELLSTNKMDLSTFTDTVSRTLNKQQINHLSKILSGKLNTDTLRDGADCFNPRHNIVFLDNKDSVVNFISVCFECGNIRTSKPQMGSFNNFESFFNSLGLKVFEMPDKHAHYFDSLKRITNPGYIISNAEKQRVYSQAISEYIKAIKKNGNINYDTLFIGNHEEFPKIKLPAAIDGKSIHLLNYVKTDKRPEKSNFILINIAEMAITKDKANFVIITFRQGYRPQHNCFVNFKYNAKNYEYELTKAVRFEKSY